VDTEKSFSHVQTERDSYPALPTMQQERGRRPEENGEQGGGEHRHSHSVPLQRAEVGFHKCLFDAENANKIQIKKSSAGIELATLVLDTIAPRRLAYRRRNDKRSYLHFNNCSGEAKQVLPVFGKMSYSVILSQ
jgi:hypothetical protein